MGWTPGYLTDTKGVGFHIEGKQMGATVRVYLGGTEIGPQFDISPATARKLARHLELAADYVDQALDDAK